MNGHPRLSFTLATLFTITLCATSLPLHASPIIVVDDSWTDGGAGNGADPLDSNWWTSSSPNAIEVAAGHLGLVTGATGRGIHTVFPTQTLSIGDMLIASFTFTTPSTVGMDRPGGFRVGLFDTLGRAGLDADVFATSSSPSPLYGDSATNTTGLPGYLMDLDVGTLAEDIAFRSHDIAAATGRLLGTTSGFTLLSPTGPDGGYSIQPDTTYTGSFAVSRITATEMELVGSLGSYTHSLTASFDSASFGMLAFWANSSVFGVSNLPNTPDNGIDFSNVRIEFHPASVPEPSMLTMLGVATLGVVSARRRRRNR